jgi:hypothetical protein
MLWNWNTIDSCFLASSWKITSNGVFAGSCIGVVLLVISLEMLRRAVKEYDRFLINKHLKSLPAAARSSKAGSDDGSPAPNCAPILDKGYRPTIFEQAIRALLHMVQFAVAYFVMLCVLLIRPCHLTLDADVAQACHVLQRLHHHLHLPRGIYRQLYFPLGTPWRVSVLDPFINPANLTNICAVDNKPARQRRPPCVAVELFWFIVVAFMIVLFGTVSAGVQVLHLPRSTLLDPGCSRRNIPSRR